jgi:hypothetical protein
MRSAILSLGALALQVAAWEYPYCEPDGCYRNLIDERFAAEANTFCPKFLSGTTTAAAAIPTAFDNCAGDVKAVSSACSCVTYTLTTSTSSAVSTTAPVSSTTSCPETTSTSVSSKAPHSYTTSTVYTTKVYTVTSCKPDVTDCPSKPHVTTETSILYTTVCPVTEETYAPTTMSTKSYGTSAPASKTTTSKALQVTAAAGKVASGFGAAAAAGVFAAAALL